MAIQPHTFVRRSSLIDPVTGKYFSDARDLQAPDPGAGPSPVGEVVVTGEGFGASPNVVLFRTFQEGEEGNTIQASPPEGEIGTFEVLTEAAGTPYYSAFNGRMGQRTHAGGDRLGQLRFIAPQTFRRFRFYFRFAMPEGGHGMEQGLTEGWGTTASWKAVWFMLDNDGFGQDHKPDHVFLSHTGQEDTPFAKGNGNAINWSSRAEWYTENWGEWNGFGIVHDCDLDDPINGGVDHPWLQVNSLEKGSENHKARTRIDTNQPAFQNKVDDAIAPTLHYDRFGSEGWSRTGGSTEDTNFWHGDYYLAIESSDGADDYRQAIALGNAPEFHDCSEVIFIPPKSWSDTEVVFDVPVGGWTHFFIFKPDDSIVSGEIEEANVNGGDVDLTSVAWMHDPDLHHLGFRFNDPADNMNGPWPEDDDPNRVPPWHYDPETTDAPNQCLTSISGGNSDPNNPRLPEIVSDAYAGNHGIKFNVVGNDSGGDSSSFRSEIADRPPYKDESGWEGTVHWVGFAIKLPSDYPQELTTGHWVAQLHNVDAGGGGSPVWGIRLHEMSGGTSWTIHRRIDGVNLGNTTLAEIGSDRGQWVRWVVQAKYTPDETGFIRVWKDDVQVFEILNVQTYHSEQIDLDRFGYYKFGIYASSYEIASGPDLECIHDQIRVAVEADGGSYATVDPASYK